MHRKALYEVQGSDLPAGGQMMNDIKRERKVRKLEKGKETSIPLKNK